MSNKPKVSIVVPVYNVEKYLEQCLDSLIHQTLRDVEFICIDDGSTDNSGIILDQYAKRDSRVKVIHNPNSGYGKTMNLGLDHATGKYIAVVESDDFAELNMIEIMYQAAEENQAEIVKANHYNYRGGVDSICYWLIDFPCGQVFQTTEHPQILKKADTIWSCLFRRDFLLEHGIRFHETPGAAYQDVSFAMQTWLWAKRIYFIEDAFLHYRNDNPDSSMHNPDKIFCTFEEFDWLEKMFEGFWERNKILERYFIASKYHDHSSHYNRIAGQYQYAFLLKLQEEINRDFERGRIYEEALGPIDYKILVDIKSDMHGFFKATGKLKEDLRTKFCTYENEQVFMKGFVDYLKGSPCVIFYGAGKVGMRLASFCLDRGLRPDYFAVTKKEVDTCMDIPVAAIDELTAFRDNAVLVLAVSEVYQYELYKNAQKYGFKHILNVDSLISKYIYL